MVTNSPAANETDSQYPSPTYAWYMVAVLTVAYVLSFVDRYILGLLVEPIKADLGISDSQMGWLLGFAFLFFYALMGLPLGYLADRKRRTWLVAAGIALWSAATAASGLAKNFTHLFLARFSVGVGEATLSPCAMSMISDSFPPERRGKPIALYTAALSLGAGIASLVSAAVLAWANTETTFALPLVGSVKPWQFTFFVVGVPGLAIAVIMFFMREPVRLDAPRDGEKKSGFGDMLGYVGTRWPVYLSFVAFVCLMTISAYSQGWFAAMFARTWDWPAQQYALVNGILLLAIGPATVNFAGWLSDRLVSRGNADAPLLIVIVGAFILIPTGIIAPLMPTPTLAFAILAINTVGIALTSATGVTALLQITPGRIRGQTVALYYMVISLAGAIGPWLVGLLSDQVFGNENLNQALAAVPLIFGLLVLPFAGFARRAYRAELDRYTAETTA